MYATLRNRIIAGGYQLADIQYKAKKLYAMGGLTEEELDELMGLSQQYAAADGERPETLMMLQKLAERVNALEQQLATQGGTDTETDAGTEQPEYEVWAAWDGISDKYQKGAIVSHGDKLWQSVFEGQNVWEPGTTGTENLWVEYIPETEG